MRRDNKKEFSKKKKIVFSLFTIISSLIIVFIICEIILRILPLPGIRYDVAQFDLLTGGGYYPNSTNFYRNDRGDFVKRKTNKYGFYDDNYKREKGVGITRIGFFGDSYTQAIQVPLEETFHYLIEDSLSDYNIETLSFGVSGFSTYQSFLTCDKWMEYFDLDIIVYVFCENDLGDQIESIAKSTRIPYPIIINNQLAEDNSFREHGKTRLSLYYRFFNYLTAKSLVFATLSERMKLLSKHGIKMKVTDEDRLNPGTAPSVWTDSLRKEAADLENLVLLKWKNEVKRRQKKLIILYTPQDLETSARQQDSWKPWLENFCIENDIPFIDPTRNLLKMQQTDHDVFYDHYTRFGHIAVNQEFTEWYSKNHDTQ